MSQVLFQVFGIHQWTKKEKPPPTPGLALMGLTEPSPVPGTERVFHKHLCLPSA